MATRKKQSMPEACCAACTHCYGERDDWKCWGLPPERVDIGEPAERGRPILPEWPICHLFKPRTQ